MLVLLLGAVEEGFEHEQVCVVGVHLEPALDFELALLYAALDQVVFGLLVQLLHLGQDEA